LGWLRRWQQLLDVIVIADEVDAQLTETVRSLMAKVKQALEGGWP
jgi:hypothetical protein